MSLNIHACQSCGTHHFPARLRCPCCGGTGFETQPVSTARVTGVVQVHRLPDKCMWSCLVELQTAAGVTFLASAARAPRVGALARIAQSEDGAIVVSPT